MPGGLDALVPELRDAARALLDACSAAGLAPRITSTLRTNAEQRRLYNRFLAGGAGYPVAPPGQSAHEYGWAFDMVVTPMEALADVGYTWKTWGGGWNPSDAIHFELQGASALAKQQAAPESAPQPTAAKFLDAAMSSMIGPWWTALLPVDLSPSNILKQAVAIEKSLGFNTAIDFIWQHLAVNPDKP